MTLTGLDLSASGTLRPAAAGVLDRLWLDKDFARFLLYGQDVPDVTDGEDA